MQFDQWVIHHMQNDFIKFRACDMKKRKTRDG